jgi:arylsulfatase A-like enzyme
MHQPKLLLSAVAPLLLAPGGGVFAAEPAPAAKPPNFIVILCDNLGYGDIGCYGSKLHRTPHVDRLAAEGMRFTDFYACSGVCTPSRASLMTGCYPRRVNLHVSDTGAAVLQPVSSKGLHPDEITLAEVLKAKGYATTCIGKWHLGDQPQFLPTRQGFDAYLGIPYSDDMTPRAGRNWPPLPLMRDEKVIEAGVDRDLLTQRYTEEAIRFLTAQRERPFFLYLAHAMPGSTMRPFASETFRDKSRNGAYGDSVEEIDWSTGEILGALRKLDLEDNTLILWTSDNGAPERNPPQGSNRPLAGWGYTTSEGGMRMPCIARWPGKVPAGKTCGEVAALMDLLPTFARLAGTKPPTGRVLDGKDIWPLLAGEADARSPHEAFYYYQMDQLQAVRSGKWKLYLPLEMKRERGAARGKASPLMLFDLAADLEEKNNVAQQHPEIVRRLTDLADRAREDLGDGDRAGKHQRPAGHEPKPTPRVLESR